MLNKTDKCFLISLIILILALVLPMALIYFLVDLSLKFNFDLPIIPELLFILSAINYIFIVPILILMQIITFMIKIFSKNKCKKDWLIIIFNFITTLFFGYIYLAVFLMVMTL